MSYHQPRLEDVFLTRRDFLGRCGMGLGATALASLLGQTGQLLGDEPRVHALAARAPHFAGSARRVIHFFLNGGPSQVDTFDPKPALARYANQALPTANPQTERKTGAAFPSPFQFRPYGRSGIEVSELFSRVAEHAD